jgi:hypothetical protein
MLHARDFSQSRALSFPSVFGCSVSSCSVLARSHFRWTAANEEENELSCSHGIFIWRCLANRGYNAKKGHEVDLKSLILEPVAAIKDANQRIGISKKSVCVSKGGFFCLADPDQSKMKGWKPFFSGDECWYSNCLGLGAS